MKTKIFLFLFVMALTAVSLIGCKIGSDTSSDEGNSDNQVDEKFIYRDGSSVSIVYGDPDLAALAVSLRDKIAGNMSGSITVAADSEPSAEHEIILGDTERALSTKAYKRLWRIEKTDTDHTSYLIYSDGNSVAVAFEEDFLDAAQADSIEYLMNEIIGMNNALTLNSGTVYQRVYDPIEKQAALDEDKLKERWKNLARTIGDDYGIVHGMAVADALEDYYSIYSESLIYWFANLYDPVTGGFYYSNSARDTVGYLPDAESTMQALNFISGSGMASEYGGKYADAIPEWMQEQVTAFIKGLQDPNGFFYHPQWGKELTDIYISRRARDLTWCTSVLSELGASPTYDTPSGVKGDGVAVSKRSLTGMLGGSVISAVSKVVAAESVTAVADHLKTKSALLEYLNGFDMKNNSYGAGNELASQASQFIARDVTLESEGADWRVCDTVIDFLDSKQYETTGTWHAEANYMGVNGLLKISSLYNELGRKINYPLKAAESAIAAITTDEEPLTICYPYNAWFSVTNIQKNLRLYSDNKTEGEEQAAKLSEALIANAPEAIAATKEKYLKFLKEDGSFSYSQTSSAANAQGLPVAVPGTNEGDVNATEIATAGVLGHMFSAFGLSKIPFFGESHRLKYVRELEGLGEVIKDAESTEVTYIDYEDDTENKEPLDATLSITSSGSATVVRDPRENHNGKVMKLVSFNDGGDTVTYACDSMRSDMNCYVFETEMCVESADYSGNIAQVILGNKAYMLTIKTVDGKLQIWDASAGSNPRLENNFGITIEIGQWFHLKVEYYPADEENVRAKVYVDGELLGVTDNYYDSTKARLEGKVGKPAQNYIEASLYVMSYHNCTMLVDNTACYKTRTPFKAVTELDKQPNINVDDEKNIPGSADPDTGNGVYYNDEKLIDATRYHYDLMGYPMPSLSGASYGAVSVEGGLLKFVRVAASGYGESYINFRVTPPDASLYQAPCTVIEFDYRVSEDSIENDNAPFRFDDSNYIRFIKNSTGDSYSLGVSDTAEIVCGEWFNIRFEIYYINEFCEYAKVFVDGSYVTTVRFVNISPFNERLLVYMKKNIKQGTEINIDNMLFCHLDKEYVAESDDFLASDITVNYTEAPGEGEYFGSNIIDGTVRYDYSNGATPSVSGSSALVLNKNGSAMFMKIASGEGYLSYNLAAPAQSRHPCTVFELDYKMIGLDPTYDNAPFRLDGNDFLRFVKNSDGVSWSIGERDTAEIVSDEWYNLRFEIYYVSESSEVVKVFVDGVHTATSELSEASAYNSRVLIYMKKSAVKDAIIFVDNVFFGHLDKEYDGEIPGEDNDTALDPDGGEGDGNEDSGGSGGDNDGDSGNGNTDGEISGDVIDTGTGTLLPGPDMGADGWTPPLN